MLLIKIVSPEIPNFNLKDSLIIHNEKTLKPKIP